MADKGSDLQLAQTWDQFCDTLKMAKEAVLQDQAPMTGKDRAAGIRMLARCISMALDKNYENADPLHPEFNHLGDWRRKQGGDNPDAQYLSAPINGSETYRVSGTLGSAAYITFTVKESGSTPWGGAAVAALFGHKMHVEPDGRFEIILSPECPEPAPKNWLKTTPNSYNLTIRQFFGDWENEQLMEAHIDRLGDPVPPPDISVESLSTGLLQSAQWLNEVVTHSLKQIGMWHNRPNELTSLHQMTTSGASGKPYKTDAAPGGFPYVGYWQLKSDEALVIRVTPPRARYWNFEMGNWCFESMDYRYRLAGTNSHYAQLEDNGELIIVISHEDPGIPNWCDASGYSGGYMACRWMEADSSPQPAIERILFADRFKHLPRLVKRIDAAGRQEQLAARRRGVMRRFAGI